MDAIKTCSTCLFERAVDESEPCATCMLSVGQNSMWHPKEPTEIEKARRAGKVEGLREASVIADDVGSRSRTDLWTAEEIVRAIDARAEEVERE